MSEQEESMTTSDETVTTETERDQENTPENVSICLMCVWNTANSEQNNAYVKSTD